MTDSSNPYRAPDNRVADAEPTKDIIPAERWRRFVNLMVDYVACLSLSSFMGTMIGLAGGGDAFFALGLAGRYLLFSLVIVSYCIVLEFTLGRTLGKFVTGTKIVDRDGRPISLKQAIFRTLSRFIPFEAFTFFGENGRGLHDKLPDTYVVKMR
ncbi:MAG TPA: RDD family protein [Xanthomonadaceae bacterium]|jgi:uncharacterized RDD family membrane protein YckC